MKNVRTHKAARDLTLDFFDRDPDTVAQDLIGAHVFVRGVGGKIVETESYDASDPASHSFRGPTAANTAMFGPPAHAYIYRSYGLHWCLNFVCRPGSAVLIRALEPTRGVQKMIVRRQTDKLKALCAGPGRLCMALAVDRALNGAYLLAPPFRLTPKAESIPLIKGPRIGITKAAAAIRRYGERSSPFLSRRF